MNRRPTGHPRYDTPKDAEVQAKPILPTRLTDALGKVSGMDAPTMNDIAAQVKENWTKLNGCAKHDFIPDPKVPFQPGRTRYLCQRCGGTIDGSAFHWWERGMRDAKA